MYLVSCLSTFYTHRKISPDRDFASGMQSMCMSFDIPDGGVNATNVHPRKKENIFWIEPKGARLYLLKNYAYISKRSAHSIDYPMLPSESLNSNEKAKEVSEYRSCVFFGRW